MQNYCAQHIHLTCLSKDLKYDFKVIDYFSSLSDTDLLNA